MSLADISGIRAFFASRAAQWEQYTAKDAMQISRAVNEAGLQPGMTVLELGCGTAPASPFLREAVGASGCVIALDVTPEMIHEARRVGRDCPAHLVIADVHSLPIATAKVDAFHAGGVVPHLEKPEQAFREWARAARSNARLSVFHAIGREALAAIHQRAPSDDDVIAPKRLAALLDSTGWAVESIDDAPERYLALAYRKPDK
jgi:ubiquinone/menaquinone biosynthesis C-methylase UbiE